MGYKLPSPHTSASSASDLAAVGAINRYHTRAWRHIWLIVWEATEWVRKGRSLPFPWMLYSHEECTIVWGKGWPADLAAWQTTQEHLGHTALWFLDLDNVYGIVLFDGA